MKTAQQLFATPSATDGRFTFEGPLPPVDQGSLAALFVESETARADYLRHRSASAQPSTFTYNLVSGPADVVGYISFRAVREDGAASAHIFIDVESVYIMPTFRRRGLSALLLFGVLQEVQTALHARSDAGRCPEAYIHFASQFESLAGTRVLRALERELLLLAKRRAGVSLLGRHLEHPRGAKAGLWERHMSGVVSP